MEGRPTSAIWLVIVVVLCFGVAVVAGQNGLLSARCAARCLTEHRDSLRSGKSRNDHRKMMNRCRLNSKCYECMKPCAVDIDVLVQRDCAKYCMKNERLCKRSCQFLLAAFQDKAGDCPTPDSATGFEAVCLNSCFHDGDCVDHRKCCPNTCGITCREPLYSGYFLPSIPNNLTLEERRKGKSVRMSWILPSVELYTGVVVYVLEHRNTTSRQPAWTDNTPWNTLALTESLAVTMRLVHAGHWYQFRVAAVTDKGTQGFSNFSSPYKSSKAVQNPQPPRNLSEGVTTLRKGQVDVTIHWQPPRYTDLPIWRYLINWSERLTSISPRLVRLDVFEKFLAGHQHEFKLKKLKPGTSYFIQIEAIVQHGNRELHSKKASLLITTYAPPNPQPESIDLEGEFGNLVATLSGADNRESMYSIYQDIIQVEGLVGGIPYYDHGVLKAELSWKVRKEFQDIVKSYMIYWTPQSCDQDYATLQSQSATSDVTSFEVYDLQYECQYLMSVNAVTKSGVQGKPTSVKIRTPVCLKIAVKGDSLQPECPVRVPHVPKSPKSLSPHIVQHKCRLHLDLKWRVPRSDLPIDGYKLHYGESRIFKEVDETYVSDEPAYKQEFVVISLTNITRTYTIKDLKESELYIIKLFAISEAGVGEPAYIEIWTPRILPCGSDKDPVPPDRSKEKTTTTQVTVTTHIPPPTEGSTVNKMAATTVPATTTTAVTVAATIPPNPSSSSSPAPYLNMYKRVYYLFLFIYKMLT